MRAIFLIAWKDIKNAFSTPLIYILLGLFSLVSGWLFFNILVGYVDRLQLLSAAEQSRISFMQEVVFSLFSNLHFLLLFFVPILTMRLIAEEKKQSTIDLLYVSPINEWQIVLGKYLAGLFFLFSMFSVTLVYPIILLGAGLDDWPVLLMSYSGLFIIGSCYLSLGLLASSLTDQQMVAAVVSFVGLLLLWMLNWMSQAVGNYWVNEFFSYFALSNHFEKWVKGWFETSSLIYFCSFVFIMLYLAVKNLQRRLW